MTGSFNRHSRRLWLCAAVVVLLALIASVHPWDSAAAQSGPGEGAPALPAENVQLIGHYGGVTHDVALQGNYAYVGEGPSLAILDVTNPAAPVLAGKSQVVPGIIFGIAVAGDYAYLAADYGGLQIVNIANPAEPVWVGSLGLPGPAYGVAVAGNFAYVADWTSGLRIVNVANPAAPVEVGLYETPGAARGVAVSGDYAYVADWIYGLRIVNITNPAAPVETGVYQNPGGAANVLVAGNYAYVAACRSGLRIIDITNPSAPTSVGAYDIGRDVYDVAINGYYAYLAGWDDGLRIVNIQNPAAPSFVKLLDTPGYLNQVAVDGTTVYAADDEGGLRIVNVANANAPYTAATYETTTQAVGVDVAGSKAYIANNKSDFWIVDVANPAAPAKAGSLAFDGDAADVRVAGNYAYVADEYHLLAIDVTNPAAPFVADAIDIGYALGVALSGSYAYVANGTSLDIIDISVPTALDYAGYLSVPGWTTDVAVAGTHAYVAASGDGLRIIDVADPYAPFETGSMGTWSATGVTVAGAYAYIADWGEGLRIIDVANPAAPVEVGYFETASDAEEVVIANGYIYVAGDEAGLMILQFTQPSPPAVTGFSPVSGRAGTTVTITGTNLNGATAVTFGGVAATSFTVNSPSQITAIVPTGATTGSIAVTTPAGTGTSAADFTVLPNQPPNAPSNPSPNSNATNIAVATSLSWSATDPDNDPLTYEVRFGTTNPPPQVVASQATTTYDPPGNLAYDTTYYWRIVARDDRGGVTPGPIWSFRTTEPPPTLTLNPVADAYTSSANPTTNYGGVDSLRVKDAAADFNAYIKFDTSALSCVQITGATLRLYTTADSSVSNAVYAVGSNWTETGINWNTAPVIAGGALDSAATSPLNTWVEYDVTAGVSAGGPVSFGVKGNGSDVVYYSSREGTRKPELVISYATLPGSAPTAAFTGTPLTGLAPLAVSFTNSSTGCPTSYLWNFGDGGTSTEANPTHTYTAPGTYTVSLTAGNNQGSDPEVKAGYITVGAPPPEMNIYFISPSGSATIGGIPATPADILRYTKTTNTWTMVYDGSVRGTAKNVSAFHLMDDGSVLLVFGANQVIAGLGTATPYDVVKFTPNNPNILPLGAGSYTWYFQGKTQGLTTSGEKIDVLDVAGNRLLLSTTGTAKLPLLPSGVLTAADEDVFVYNMGTSRWENTLLIDGSKITGMSGEDIGSIWDDPTSSDYYITITGAFNLGGVKGNGKSIVKLTPNAGATVFTPSLVQWLAPGATFPSNLDGLDIGQ